MKKIHLVLISIALVASSCRLPAALEAQAPTPYDSGEIQPPQVVLLARQALAGELGIQAERITISTIESTRWQDTCLELPAPNETCQPAEIDGYRVVLKSPSQEFTYHTDLQDTFRRAPQSKWGQAALQSQRLLAGLLGYDPDSVQIVSELPATFSDTCLDIHIAETACANIRTAGTIVTLQAGEQQFTFHSALHPVEPVLAEAAGFSTSTPTITWSRKGERLGLCDTLLLYLSGWAVQYSCIGTTGQNPGVIGLTPSQQRQLLAWTLAYRPFEFHQTSTDGVTENIIFFGLGQVDPSYEEKNAISEYTVQMLKPPATPVPTRPQATP